MYEKTLVRLSKMAEASSMIKQELYDNYDVKRGLRNKNHTGVLVGLTHIGDVIGYSMQDNKPIPMDGKLLYRGIKITDIVDSFQKEKRQGFD